jgi:hypothetical protein
MLKDTLDLITDIFMRDDTASFPVYTVGHTLIKQFALRIRAIIMSPHSVHLRGGSVLILKQLELFESKMNLGRMTLQQIYSEKDMAFGGLPGFGKGKNSVNNAEVELRRALSFSSTVKEALSYLVSIKAMLKVLAHVAAKGAWCYMRLYNILIIV